VATASFYRVAPADETEVLVQGGAATLRLRDRETAAAFS
jgi:hypothetical protein